MASDYAKMKEDLHKDNNVTPPEENKLKMNEENLKNDRADVNLNQSNLFENKSIKDNKAQKYTNDQKKEEQLCQIASDLMFVPTAEKQDANISINTIEPTQTIQPQADGLETIYANDLVPKPVVQPDISLNDIKTANNAINVGDINCDDKSYGDIISLYCSQPIINTPKTLHNENTITLNQIPSNETSGCAQPTPPSPPIKPKICPININPVSNAVASNTIVPLRQKQCPIPPTPPLLPDTSRVNAPMVKHYPIRNFPQTMNNANTNGAPIVAQRNAVQTTVATLPYFYTSTIVKYITSTYPVYSKVPVQTRTAISYVTTIQSQIITKPIYSTIMQPIYYTTSYPVYSTITIPITKTSTVPVNYTQTLTLPSNDNYEIKALLYDMSNKLKPIAALNAQNNEICRLNSKLHSIYEVIKSGAIIKNSLPICNTSQCMYKPRTVVESNICGPKMCSSMCVIPKCNLTNSTRTIMVKTCYGSKCTDGSTKTTSISCDEDKSATKSSTSSFITITSTETTTILHKKSTMKCNQDSTCTLSLSELINEDISNGIETVSRTKSDLSSVDASETDHKTKTKCLEEDNKTKTLTTSKVSSLCDSNQSSTDSQEGKSSITCTTTVYSNSSCKNGNCSTSSNTDSDSTKKTSTYYHTSTTVKVNTCNCQPPIKKICTDTTKQKKCDCSKDHKICCIKPKENSECKTTTGKTDVCKKTTTKNDECRKTEDKDTKCKLTKTKNNECKPSTETFTMTLSKAEKNIPEVGEALSESNNDVRYVLLSDILGEVDD